MSHPDEEAGEKDKAQEREAVAKEQSQPDEDEREPLLEPEELSDPSGEFRQEHLAEKAKHGLDQLDGPDIEAVIEGEKGAPEEDEEKG